MVLATRGTSQTTLVRRGRVSYLLHTGRNDLGRFSSEFGSAIGCTSDR